MKDVLNWTEVLILAYVFLNFERSSLVFELLRLKNFSQNLGYVKDVYHNWNVGRLARLRYTGRACWKLVSNRGILKAVVFSMSNKAPAAVIYITNKRISYYVMFSMLINVKSLPYFLENCDDQRKRVYMIELMFFLSFCCGFPPVQRNDSNKLLKYLCCIYIPSIVK